MKSHRIVGMVVFTAVVVFFLWYVDYNRNGHIVLVGFGTSPYGYGSVIYGLLDKVFGSDYTHRSENLFWVITQIAPLLLSWGLRYQLGQLAGFIWRIVERVYKAV